MAMAGVVYRTDLTRHGRRPFVDLSSCFPHDKSENGRVVIVEHDRENRVDRRKRRSVPRERRTVDSCRLPHVLQTHHFLSLLANRLAPKSIASPKLPILCPLVGRKTLKVLWRRIRGAVRHVTAPHRGCERALNRVYKLIINLPAVLLLLFCGAWSDRVGRKLPIILSSFGTVIAVIFFMISRVTPACSHQPSQRPAVVAAAADDDDGSVV